MCMCMQMIMAQQLRQQKPAAPRMLGGRAAQPPPRLALPWAAARPGWRALRLAAGYEQRPLSQEERGPQERLRCYTKSGKEHRFMAAASALHVGSLSQPVWHLRPHMHAGSMHGLQ